MGARHELGDGLIGKKPDLGLGLDDMLVVGSNMQDINVLKRKLSKSFVMKDLGVVKQILGMLITKDRKNKKIDIVSRWIKRKVVGEV